ncbi:MAG: alpha/beta fold hydrolase [Halolamina sp.]
MTSVRHDGRATTYCRFDRGATRPGVLCVHGSGGDAGVWKSQARLAEAYPVVAVDLAGHRDSADVDAEPGRPTLEAYADDVVAVAQATGASVLVGNSLGGAVALWVALERDLALDALVLAGTGARLAVDDDLLAWLADDFDRAVEVLHGENRLFHDVDARYRELSRATMAETGPAVTERDFRTCDRFDVRDRLDEVDVPALAAVGEHDRLTPPRLHDSLADGLPTCELAVVEDAAHLAMLERPTAFNAAVRSFLDRTV